MILFVRDAMDLRQKNAMSALSMRILMNTGAFAITTGEVARVIRGRGCVTLNVSIASGLILISVLVALKTPT